ncbi:hypothetical protein ES705_28626 [subsurface metagenome]
MNEPNLKREIQKEAEDLITLGNLLSTDRNQKKQLSVENVMHSNLSIQEKIKRIRKVDQSVEEHPDKGKILQKGKGVILKDLKSGKGKILQKGKGVILRDMKRKRAKKAGVEIKASHNPRSYLFFLFKEYRNVREFGKKTHIFVSVLFPPMVRLNKDLGTFFAKYLQPAAAELLEILNPVLEIGWLYLHKIDYNLISGLKKLCRKINSTNFKLLNYKDKMLINRLRSLENHFLMLQYRSEYPEKIISACDTVLNKDLNFEADPNNMPGLVRKILAKEVMLPSLYNFLLGLNMLKYNRFFTLSELIRRNSGEIIDSSDFDCELKIYDKIQSYIEESTQNLLLLHEKKKGILKLRDFLPTNENGEADFSRLQFFYDAFQSKNKYHYVKDKENIVLFTPRFLRLFVHTFEHLLNGKVHLSKVGKVEIFSEAFFQIELSKLPYLIEKMEKLAFSYPTFSRSRYLLIKSTNAGAIAIEAELMHVIEECLDYLLGIGKKLSSVLSLREKIGTSEGKSEPLDTIILRGKSFSLPYEEKVIKSGNITNGRTVLEALTMAISMSFLAAILFNDQNTTSLLIREQFGPSLRYWRE